MIITRKSPISGKVNSLDLPITKLQLEVWKRGVLIQNAFPNLSPDEREFLKTGITSEEWEAMFAGKEE
jgi:hypothetical protein